MSENGSKKREWVKTAAIVFLAVLLVLTFFSNTIQNYSLPEVATQYVMSGTITAKIRGTGTIESGDPYEVKVTETRKVTGVAVHVGDTVQKGDVLVYLDDAESDELKAAREALDKAKDDYDKALLTAEVKAADIQAAGSNVSADTYRQQINSLQQQITGAETKEKQWSDEVARLTQVVADFEMQISVTPDNTEDVSEETKAVENAQKAVNEATNNQTAALNAKTAAENKVSEIQARMEYLVSVSSGDSDEYRTLAADLETAKASNLIATANYNKATEALANANLQLTKAQQAYDSKKGNSGTITNLTNQMNAYKLSLYNAQKELTAATTAKEEKEKALTELVAKINNAYNLESYQEVISKAQELVDELTEKCIDATITADIAGTVTAINVTAGNSTSAATPVAVLQPEGKGYTMSFSVTNEQAKRLSVGDKADLVNAWRYDDVDVTLSSIKPDTTEPGQKKLLTFNVSGSVTAGQTLNVSVGQKSANFDLIVPNSAIREDNNGKFILIVESKSSPLGNRYVASRVDVEVLASDDTQTAISGGLYGYEYVITTSSAPVEAGKLVRLADN